jgi:hypothetical protein
LHFRSEPGIELETCQPGSGNEAGIHGAVCSHNGHLQVKSDEGLEGTYPVDNPQAFFSADKLRSENAQLSSHDFTLLERCGEIFPTGSECKFFSDGALGDTLLSDDAYSAKLLLGAQ